MCSKVYAEDDITKSVEYQSLMNSIRNNSPEKKNREEINTNYFEQVPIEQSSISNNNNDKYKTPSSFNIYTFYPNNGYLNQKINAYNNIITKYNALNKSIDNADLLNEYINTVENYRNKYGDISLKTEQITNYPILMKRLGYAYEKFERIDNAIIIYESLLFEMQNDISIKKHLIQLYDITKSCAKAKYMLEDVSKYEPNYHTKLINCETKLTPPNFNPKKRDYNNWELSSENRNVNNTYDWETIYVIYFGIWGLIILLWLSINWLINLSDESWHLGNYKVKFRSDGSPIKPEVEEFGFDQDSFQQINFKLNSTENLDKRVYWIAPLSMLFITRFFSAPNFLFPIFLEGDGRIWGVVFWIISGFAINKLKNKFILLTNIENIKNYKAYTNASNMYIEARKNYNYKLAQIEEQRRKDYERKRRKEKDYWYNLNPFDFEKQIGELYKSLGYKVLVTQKSNDGGIDVIIEKGNIRKGVQCKKYKSKVGRPDVQQLWGAKDCFKLNNKKQRIDGVIMIALSGVSTQAKEFIQEFPEYELWTIDTILAKAKEADYYYYNKY